MPVPPPLTFPRVYFLNVTGAYKTFYLVQKSTEECCDVLTRPQEKTERISRPLLRGAVMGGVAASQKQLPDDHAPEALTYRCGIYSAGISSLVLFLYSHGSVSGLRNVTVGACG